MEDCLFCKMIRGEIPCKKVYEDDDLILIEDIAPQAPVHMLMIPKSHFKMLSEMTKAQSELLGKCLAKLPQIDAVKRLEEAGGYRLVINQGNDAGQTVPHLHVHVLAGKKMGWTPA